MGKQAKSQWDFGELFPPEQLRRVLSVSELTSQIKRVLEAQVGTIWVSGEITNLRAQNSGHVYFTLKDAGGQLSCVLFRGETIPHRDLLADGQKVLLQGDITVYEARGQYQLIVRAMELQGIGALQVAFEKLKQKLAAEGLFALERKRPLPKFPRRIGLVTSPTGAAIRDVLHCVQRRNPGLEIILAPCRVQGGGASEEIADAIRLLNEFSEGRVKRAQNAGDTVQKGTRVTRPSESFSEVRSSEKLDLILVTRGGGSLEDLWAFNEEIVARAIFESAIPVVSAVGHEIDFTISDFVADIRAATPSAAAEVITEGVFASRAFVSDAPLTMRQCVRLRLARNRDELENVKARFARKHPRRRLNEALQRLDDLRSSLLRCAKSGVRRNAIAWKNAAARLSRLRPSTIVRHRRESFELEVKRMRELATARLRDLQNRFRAVEARLKLLGPEQVLARGYSITTDEATGKILRDAKAVKRGQKLKTRLKRGEIRSVAEG